MNPYKMPKHNGCRHVRPDGTACKGWANRTGLCPPHDKMAARTRRKVETK